MATEWSTERIHPRDRLAWWVDEVAASCQVNFTPQRSERFFGRASIADLAGILQIGNGASSAQVLTRSPRHIARGDDRLCITVVASGRSLVSQHGREVVLTQGDFILTDRSRHYEFTCDGDFSHTLLMIPRNLLTRRIGPVERFISIQVDGHSGFGALLSPMLQTLPARLSAIPVDLHSRVGENIVDLIATALLSQPEHAHSSAHLTNVRVKFWIENHLSENLSSERIAGACGVSVRHLNRLFNQERTSLMEYVWERRLSLCRRVLSDPRMADRTISEVAIAGGFRDLSHFSRAYRERFGHSPREERNS
jgi:AraC family transcriptional regulator, positive regulator of tynA and feaB